MSFTLTASGDQSGDALTTVLDALKTVFASDPGFLSADVSITDETGTTRESLLPPPPPPPEPPPAPPGNGTPTPPGGDPVDAAFISATDDRLSALEASASTTATQLTTISDTLSTLSAKVDALATPPAAPAPGA